MEFQEKWAVDCTACEHKITSDKCICSHCNSGKVMMNRYLSRNGYTRVSFGCQICKVETNEVMPCPECSTAVDVAIFARKKPNFFERLFLAH